jgi:hypothetical protein
MALTVSGRSWQDAVENSWILGNNIFTFKAEGTGVNLTGLANPVTVVLTIGIDSATGDTS